MIGIGYALDYAPGRKTGKPEADNSEDPLPKGLLKESCKRASAPSGLPARAEGSEHS